MDPEDRPDPAERRPNPMASVYVMLAILALVLGAAMISGSFRDRTVDPPVTEIAPPPAANPPKT